MRLKPSPVRIDPEDPFSVDALDRARLTEPLNAVIQSTQESLVVSVEAPWGGGKTTFLNMWSADLKRQKRPILNFNAWESDFSGTALVSLLAELDEGLRALAPSPKFDRAVQGVKRAGAGILKRAFPLAVRLGTGGLVDLSDFDEDVQKAATQLGESLASDVVSSYGIAKSSLADFKSRLGEFSEQIRQESGFPLTICVDELDRCRPDYAVQMLEAVKHLFDVPGVVFVLALNREQLEHSVRALYGSGMDASQYLRRFIDVPFRLPPPDAERFLKQAMDRYGISAEIRRRMNGSIHYNGGDPNQIPDALARLFALFDFSLRTQEQLLTLLSVVLHSTTDKRNLFPEMLAVLLSLNAADQRLYRRYVAGTASADEVLPKIRGTLRGEEFLNSNEGIGVEGWIRICDGRSRGEDPFGRFRDARTNTDLSESEKARAIALEEFESWFHGRVVPHGQRRAHRIVRDLARHIDLLENFVDREAKDT